MKDRYNYQKNGARRWLVAALVLATIAAGCAVEGSGTSTSSSVVGSDTSTSTSSTVTTTTVPKSTSTTATTLTTATTSMTTSTTTTTVPEPDEVRLSFDGLGVVEFGTSEQPTTTAVAATLGDPDEDTGWLGSAQSPFGVCGGDEYRMVRWGQLGVLFTNGSGGDGRHFAMYGYGDFINVAPGTPALATPEGITVTDTASDVLNTYGEKATFVAGSEVVAPYISVASTTGVDMIFHIDGTKTSGTVTSIRAGYSCGE